MKLFHPVKDTILGWFGCRPAKPEYFLDFVARGKFEVVGQLLELDRTLVEKKGHFGEGALQLAVEGRCLKTVECLLGHGADVNAVDRENITALHHAAELCDVSIVVALLQAGASAEIRDENGDKPADWTEDAEIRARLANGA